MDDQETLLRAALAVALISQRDGGLWFRATSELDFDSYAPTGSQESRAREDAPFGFVSITVSWYALCGLRRTLGDELDKICQVERVVDEICTMRSEAGAYGTYHGGWQATRQVIESPRHTAVAVICQLEFSSYLRTAPSHSHICPSIDWLLSVRAADGGWGYDPRSVGRGSDPLSTAAVIAAICLYANRFRVELGADAEALERLRAAIADAVVFLLRALRENDAGLKVLWEPAHPQKAFRISDTAEAFEFLVRAISYAQESDLNLDFKELEARISSFVDAYAPMPQAVDPHVLASWLALTAECTRAGVCSSDTASRVTQAQSALTRAISSRPDEMRLWSWLCVLNGVLPGDRRDLAAYCRRVDVARRLSGGGKRGGALDQALWRFVPRIGRRPVLYACSGGRPGDVPIMFADRWFRGLPVYARWALRGAGAIVVFLLTIAVENSTDALNWLSFD